MYPLLQKKAFLPSVSVDGMPLKLFNRVIYLGVSLSSIGVTNRYIYDAAGQAQGMVHILYAVGIFHRGFSIRQALRLWRKLLHPL